jgi:hypothetical protein
MMQTLFLNSTDYCSLRAALGYFDQPDFMKLRDLLGEDIYWDVIKHAQCGGTTNVLVDNELTKPRLFDDTKNAA